MWNATCVKKKLNNAGMTLVELIVAIAIIIVAIIPLMFGFIFVLKNNLRAREVQQTTVLAHTVMENCKAFPVTEIPLKVAGGTFLNGVSASDGHFHPSADIIYLDGAPVGERNFDVMLTLDARGTASSLLDYEEMNAYNDAVFQSQTAISTGTNPIFAYEADNKAYIKMLEALKQKAQETVNNSSSLTDEQKASFNVSLSTLDESFKVGGINSSVNYDLKREIIISANSSGADYATVTYKYSYALSGAYKVKWLSPDGTNYWDITVSADSSDSDWVTATTYTFQVYDSTETGSHGAELENLYFFYYPAYKSNDNLTLEFQVVEDKITINNNLGRGLNVYLFKQLNPTLGEHNTTIVEATYQPQVYGNGDAINLYHNLFENIGTSGSGNSWSEAMLHHSGNVSTLGTAETLISTVPKSLIFDITVGVYPEGTYDETTNTWDDTVEAITTLKGTVLNK